MPGERFDHLGRRNTGLPPRNRKSEKCHSVVQSLAQFDLRASADQLQLEWLSDTELRAWHPSFEPGNQADGSRLKRDAPVKMVFAPKR